jgi:outer membrane protein assembly factor BamB
MSIKTKWKYSLKGARSVKQRCPVVHGDSVFVTFNHGQGSNFQGSLASLDIETGEEQWRFDASHYLNEPSVSKDGFIYLTSFDGAAYKIGLNGEMQWKSQPSERNVWAGLVIDETFYYAEIAGQSKYTRALNTSDGSILWEYENGGHSYALATDLQNCIVHCSVSGSFDETVIFLHCLNKETGKAIWKSKYSQYLFQSLIFQNLVYIGSRGHVALFRLENGELLTTFPIEEGVAVKEAPIETRNGIVFVSEKGRVFCLRAVERKKGLLRKKNTELQEVWSLDLSSEINARLVLKNDQLLAVKDDGHLIEINLDSGEIQNKQKLPGFKQAYGIAAYNDDLIVSVSKDCARMEIKI